jgi:hypothetical protein
VRRSAGGAHRRHVSLLSFSSLATGAVVLGALAGADVVIASHAPPRPIVSSHATRVEAAQGSYCWSDLTRTHGRCATRPFPDRTRRSVDVHPGSRIAVDLRYPAEALKVRSRTGGRCASARSVGGRGRRWSFRVPRCLRRSRGVIMEVRYDRGTGIFGVRLRLHRHRHR